MTIGTIKKLRDKAILEVVSSFSEPLEQYGIRAGEVVDAVFDAVNLKGLLRERDGLSQTTDRIFTSFCYFSKEMEYLADTLPRREE